MNCTNQGRHCTECLNASRAALWMPPLSEEEEEGKVYPAVMAVLFFAIAGFVAVALWGARFQWPMN